MREILFRGKRVDNGEWVEGYLLRYSNGNALIMKEFQRNELVDPSTVGQYTGLTDKNGKKIFEGDIIRTKKYGKVVMDSCVNDFDVFSVVYEPCMFRLEREDPPRCFNLVGNGADYEVIGNIHDNPELIGGEKK